MNKKLALQKLAQLRDIEKDKEKRILITTFYNRLKFDKLGYLEIAINIINDYKEQAEKELNKIIID